MLSDNQWQLADQIAPVLRELAVATEILCYDDIPTITSYYPLVFSVASKMAVKADDGGVVSEFKTRVINGLQGRLLNDNYWETEPMVASVFDPSTKDLRFLTEETRETVYDNVKRALDIINSAQEPEAAADAEPVAKKSAISVIASFLGSEITNIESADQHFDEFQSYLSCRISDVVNPLEWWSVNRRKYPMLAKLARRYLAIQATSVPSERLFSAAGNTITKKRNALCSDTADKLLFLNKNMK